MTMTAPTLHDLQQGWLEHLERQGKSPHTLRAYAQGLRHFAQWYALTYGAELAPAQVMPRDVRDWKARQQTVAGAAPATVNQRLVAVSRFFRWARAQGHCRESPAEGVKQIRLPHRQPQALRKGELRRLLRAARGQLRDYAMLEMLAGTGLRVGELLALRVGDVQINERSGQVTVRHGKGGGYREVPLTLDVRKALTAYLEEVHPDHDDPAAPLWLGPNGGLRHRSSVTRLLGKYALRAGLEPIHPHTLRHTFASRYLNVNPGDLRGHSSLDTVMVYTEPRLEDLTERMERVEVAESNLAAK